MTISDEHLAAYADGELSGMEAERVAATIAADPALAARFDAEKRLRTMLRGHLDPVISEPVPEDLTLMIAAVAAEAAEDEVTDAGVGRSAPVLDFASARARRDASARAAAKAAGAPRRPLGRGWGMGIAIAASLVLGVGLGTRLHQADVRTAGDGRLVAEGSLAHGLDTQLASAGSDDTAGLRILTSFRRDGAGYCRVYQAGAASGIACRDGDAWVLDRTMTTGIRQAGQYRQAGSPEGELMAAAQAMTSAAPLDAAQERAARSAGWSIKP